MSDSDETHARPPGLGEFAPWFKAATESNPTFHFHSVGGRYIVLLFAGAVDAGAAPNAIWAVHEARDVFNDAHAAFFGVTVKPEDRNAEAARTILPGVRWFFDFDGAVSRLYGALGSDLKLETGRTTYRQFWLVLDPTLRVMMAAPVTGEDGGAGPILKRLRDAPPPPLHGGVSINAPILVAPRIFERDFCKRLIAAYEGGGAKPSGFMTEVDGKTTLRTDSSFKRRTDHTIEDDALRAMARARVKDRLTPIIQRAFQFRTTRMERYIVACYDAEPGGFFRPHRDNTTKGTAHRRFAVTINLNAEDYEGGELRFPEYGPTTYRAPTGGAVVFSCSLLHEATPVTKGRRYAFLPFLYDDEGARIREQNNPYLSPEVTPYQSDAPVV